MIAAAPAALKSEQIGVLARAVSRAPSVHNSRPWQLLVRGTEVDLLERREVELRRHDPTGRDRVLSCGAAVTDLELAVRVLGRDCHVEVRADDDVVATVTIGRPRMASTRDFALYQAISRRRSRRRRFFHNRVPAAVHSALVAAGETTGVHLAAPGRGEPAGRLHRRRHGACRRRSSATDSRPFRPRRRRGFPSASSSPTDPQEGLR